jgi:acyl phosphate:glycerol-3-phosphate acyltransferase
VAAVFVTALALLLGSIPSGLVLSWYFTGRDIRRAGSGNIGAANVAREAGFKIGVLVALLDIAKGMVPVAIGTKVGLGHPALAIVGLAAVAGHDFSIFLRFRGGKGVATTLGVALALALPATLLALVIWVATVAIWRYASLASLLALAFLPLGAYLTGRSPAYVILFLGLFLLAAAKHWENIVRLVQGTETRIRMPGTAG